MALCSNSPDLVIPPLYTVFPIDKIALSGAKGPFGFSMQEKEKIKGIEV